MAKQTIKKKSKSRQQDSRKRREQRGKLNYKYGNRIGIDGDIQASATNRRKKSGEPLPISHKANVGHPRNRAFGSAIKRKLESYEVRIDDLEREINQMKGRGEDNTSDFRQKKRLLNQLTLEQANMQRRAEVAGDKKKLGR